jgi:ribosomal protein S18 acetylase RimI-like enzyme
MPKIEIRPAVLADFTRLVSLEHSFQTPYVWQMDRSLEEGQVTVNFREVRLPRPVRVDYPHSPEKLVENWKTLSEMLVASIGGAQVGYIALKEQSVPDALWVIDLVVGEKSRRKGIGSALVLAAQEWAAQHGRRRIIFEMQSKNYPAIKLALKLGYEFCGYNDHYYANQDIALFFAGFLR